MLNNNTFKHIRLVFEQTFRNNQYATYEGWSIGENGWKKGGIETAHEAIHLLYEDGIVFYQIVNAESIICSSAPKGFPWRKIITDPDYYMYLILLSTECQNRYRFNQRVHAHTVINQEGWGKGTT